MLLHTLAHCIGPLRLCTGRRLDDRKVQARGGQRDELARFDMGQRGGWRCVERGQAAAQHVLQCGGPALVGHMYGIDLGHVIEQLASQVGGVAAVPGAAVALVGPGTGLGVSGLVFPPGSAAGVPLSGEGGHVTLAAENETDAKTRLDEFNDTWGGRYPAIKGLWDSAWAEFVPFLDYSPEIRRVIYSTNAIESLNARMRRATRARGHFPQRASSAQVPLPHRQVPRPDRQRSRPLDEPLEARSQRLRHHLRRPTLHHQPLKPPCPLTPNT